MKYTNLDLFIDVILALLSLFAGIIASLKDDSAVAVLLFILFFVMLHKLKTGLTPP